MANESSIVQAGVTSIGADAFLYCSSLTNLTIGNGLTSVGDSAFLTCYDLTNIYFRGNAPSSFQLSSFDRGVVTANYLPGTTGWSEFTTATGIPTELWLLPKPTILNFGPGFGVQTNNFGFTISWATNAAVVVEACDNLANPVWSPVATNTLTNGVSFFSEPVQTNIASDYYRIRTP